KAAQEKADKLAQAQKALEAGDYDKAQAILNSIPSAQRNDSDVSAMRNKIASEKQAAQAKAAAEKAAKEKADKLAQAQKALDAGDYAKAQQILNELAKTNKGDSQVQDMLNKANAQQKAAEEKLAAQKAAEQQAAQKAAQEKADKLAQAQKALEAGDYDKAQAILNSIPAAQRNDPDVNAMRNKIAGEKQAAQAKAAAEKAAQEKADKLAQAQKALEAGDYDKAQAILNSIPSSQRNDSDVAAMRNKIASEKQAAQAKAAAEKAAQEKADKLAQAQKALDAGDYAKAQAILNTLPSSDKRDTDVQALIGKAAAQEKEALAKKAAEEERVKKAAEEAEKAKKQAELAALQKNIDSEIAKGKAALAAGNVEEAIAHFNKAMSMLPSDDPAYAAKKKSESAQALYDASENTDNPADKKKLADTAKTLANEAVAKGSDDAGSHYVLGMEALKNKNYALAEAEFEKAIKADPKNASYYYQLGRAQAQQGKYKAAQASFKNSTELNPKFAPAFYNLGYVSERLNDNTQALVSYRKAYQIDNDYERAYIAAGRIMARQGDNQGASAAFDKAIKINPANSQTYQEYGSALAAIGNYAEAETSFKKAIAYMDKSKSDPATYYNLSTVLLAQNKNSEALSYAKQSYELKNSAGNELKNNIAYNYALAQEKTGNAEMAKSLYNEVLLNDPNNVKARTNLGALYNEAGQSDSAISVLSKAYELDSSNFEVNNNLGNAYNKKENFTEAIKYYQNALNISPKDNTVRANLAKAYAGAKQYDSAKVTYEDVIAANSKDWESYLELSKVCIALGDMDSAETYLTYLQKNNPTYKMAEVAKLLASIKK
ncbi:MAG: tetratricopeptide repeat protein, partial [Treponema sp.]|nr:tetratricopeptide repeat protein [Treponema sp.]